MASLAAPRNFLDNGSMDVNQRAVTATAATTSGLVETSYSPDRWGADVNMAAGAGQFAVVTSTPTPYPGFANSATLVRNSGALGQPVCALQEVPSQRVAQLAGQQVDLSAYMQGLAGLVADNGGQANLYLITGTGTDQGLGALRSAVGMTTTVKASSVTVATTGILTNASAVVAGQPVYMTATTMPTGFVSGQMYYVSSTNLSSGTSFSVASTYAAAIAGTVLAPSSTGGTVVINIPYITPAWTGVAVYGANGASTFGSALSQPFTLSASSWGRFQTGSISVPSTVTEAAVAVCFTPMNTSSGGATDGIAFSGVQLEVMGANQTTASAFEFQPYAREYLDALRYAWIIAEPAAAVSTPFNTGAYTSTTTCELRANTIVPMSIIPTVSFTGTALGTGTFSILTGYASAIALASTFLVQSTLGTNSVNTVALKATTAAEVLGGSCILIGAAGGAVINIGADF
jgi:hypothetical protein